MDRYTYNRQPAQMNRVQPKRRRVWKHSILLIVFFAFALGVFVVAGHSKAEMTANYLAYTEKLKMWFAAHKGHVKQKIARVKAVTQPAKEEPIQFEFYSALPKRQLAHFNSHREADASSSPTLLSHNKSRVTPEMIFDAKTLEKDIAKHVTE